MSKAEHLSRRERQVLDIIYELEEVTAKEVHKQLPQAPSYSSVRTVLTRLVDRGLIRFRESGPRYVYRAAADRPTLRRAALKKTVDTFFEGSAANAINALIGISAKELTQEELDELASLISDARENSND